MLIRSALRRFALASCLCGLAAGSLAASPTAFLGDDIIADNCAGADVILVPGSFSFSNNGATLDGPASCGSIGSDVWAVFAAPEDGVVTALTCGAASFDTVLAAYDGDACVGTELDCNDDSCSLQSQISFPVTGGQPYLLRIGGFGGAQGSGVLTVDFAALDCDADSCSDPDYISGFGTFGFSTLDATTDGPSHGSCAKFGNPEVYNDIWCSWTSPITGSASVSTCDQTDLDSKIAVYASNICTGPLLDCNDDTCGFQSYVSFPVQAGSTYLIRIGGFGENSFGSGTFTVSGYATSELACEEFDRFKDLTANDTFTTTTNGHNPEQAQGFAYAYAVDGSGNAMGFDHLIGQVLVVNGLDFLEYSVNTVNYKAMGSDFVGTDSDSDGIRDLDGVEYQKTAGEILVPRFLGQNDRVWSHLVLLSLTGGSEYYTTANFLVYNDNEEQYSTQYEFRCWDKVPLLSISNVFHNVFLSEFSGDDPFEGVGPNQEYGWFRMFGSHASSTFFDLVDPAVYGVLVEQAGGSAAADLPFERCIQSGHLLPRLVTGDNSETPGSLSDQSCNVNVGRSEPASLLIYPEFDNRSGTATVFTITNTNEIYDVRTHFVYIGRYGN